MRFWMALIGSAILLPAIGVMAASRDHDTGVRSPLRLPNGEPMIGIYFFGHWWEPWMRDDDAIRRDLRRLRGMGFNTLFLDHQFSQMLDGDWKWIDREHRLAKEAGFAVVPWLESHGGADIALGDRMQAAGKILNVSGEIPRTINQNGSPGVALVTSEEYKRYLIAYVKRYLDRYRENGALLRVMKNGRPRPVVTLGCELDLTMYDEETNRSFVAWLRRRFRSDIDRLNDAWGTSYRVFEEIDPRDATVFDYSDPSRRLPAACRHHALFRAERGAAAFADIRRRLRKTDPDLLILAEMPYPFDSGHPHGQSYQWSCASLPEAFRFADLLLLRWTQGRAVESEREALARFRRLSRADVLVGYRVSPLLERAFGADAAELANGLAFYSWNEMVDCHAAPNPPGVGLADFRLTEPQSDGIVAGMRAAVDGFRDAVVTLSRTGSGPTRAKPPRLSSESVTVYPAPEGEALSRDYTVRVGGRDVPVYPARVAPADPERRWKGMDDKANSADYYDQASFASFDLRKATTVTVTCPEAVSSVKILPSAFGVVPKVNGSRITFPVGKPGHLTLEVNGRWVNALHLFVNPPETGAPRPNDPNVVYFGPGIHEVSHMEIGDGKTVYLAGGSVVRAMIRPDEKFTVSGYSGLRNYAPTFTLKGKNIRFRGRGILDGSACPTHARNMIHVEGSDIEIEGVILRDPSVWTIPIRRSDRVSVKNVKIIGYRANSDGIDICNSRDVTVEDSFVRTLDDLIVVKTDPRQGEASRITAKRCVLWNEVAHALSVGAELSDPVSDVLFTDCDVIHDKGREWTLRVFHSDAALISGIRFEKIRIEESKRLASVWIGKAFWTRDDERGRVRDVVFRDIDAKANPLVIDLVGFDENHAVEGVLFENVKVNGRPLRSSEVKRNAYVRDVTVRP